MLNSMNSGVSGMKSQQTKMDVTANNIANVNTYGYKSERVTFQDVMSNTESNAQAPGMNGSGGVNPKQVGLGVQVGSIDKNNTIGTPQPTGRPLDFALDDQGYFVLQKDDGDETKYYTRNGAFTLDANGTLTNVDGYKVMGYQTADGQPIQNSKDFNAQEDLSEPVGPITIPNKMEVPELDEEGNPVLDENGNPKMKEITLMNFTIGQDGLVTGRYSDDNTYVIGQVAVTTFANPDGLEKTGGNNYVQSGNSGEPNYVRAGQSGSGRLIQGALEGSNVDLATEFTDMIITSRAYQANSRTITTSDEMLQELINLKR